MKKLYFLGCLLLVLFSCSKNKQQISLSYTDLNGEVPVTGSFSFVFNQEVAPDSILYYWDETPYVKFSPTIKGSYKWLSRNELSFTPQEVLLPGTEYSANFTNEILAVNHQFKDVDIEEIEFHTPFLSLTNQSLYWYKDDLGKTGAKLQLDFNYKVDYSEVIKKINLKSDGKKYNVIALSEGAGYYPEFEIEDILVQDEDQVFELSIDASLTPMGSNNSMQEDIVKSLHLKSPYQIDITGVNTDHNGVEGVVAIQTSQEIDKNNVKSFISISPKIAFTVDVNPNELIVKSSAFDVKEKYRITLKEGLTGKVGGQLKAAYEADVVFGEIEPTIEFDNNKGMYLSSVGNKNIGIRIINVPEVKLKVYKLYENNVLNVNTFQQYFGSYYGEYYYDGDLQEMDLIYEEKYTSDDFKKIGNLSLLEFNFKDVVKDYNGIYFIKVQSTEDYWLTDGKFVSFSDIGLICKTGQNKVNVFCNSIATTESLSGVNIKLYGKNNQLIDEAVTGSDGSVALQLNNSNLNGFKPTLVTAEKNGSFSIINLQDAYVSTSRFEVGGYRDLPNGLQTYIYFERNIYRPGEKINLATIVRNQTWNSPGQLPIKIELLTPQGKKLNALKKTLNDAGSAEASFDIAADAMTGSYQVFVYSSNDVLLASKSVLVEEFMPDRIKVSTSLSNKELTPQNDKTRLDISAQNLFGPPAANRNYEVEISYRRKYFSPKDYGSYNFYITNANQYLGVDNREGVTDELGKAFEDLEMPSSFANMGVLQADLFTTVFDETGRPVNQKQTLDVYTQDVFYGIGYFNYYLSTNASMQIPIVAVNKDGKALSNTKARIEIIKHEYQTVLSKSGSYYRYESNKVEKKLINKSITLNGESNFNFTPDISGRYEVRIYNPEVDGKYISRFFYAYGYGKTYLSSFEVDNEGQIDIEMDKEEYEVGDNAKLLFKTPFQGKLLVTVEGKDVLEHFYVQTDKKSAEVSLGMTAEYLPNVYVSATLIKEHEESEFPLTVAHGFQSIGVKESKRNMNLQIVSVDESRSKTTQKIKVKGPSNATISIAVVDEGILQVGNFSTPKPYDYFYQKRALQVRSADIYPYLLPEISAANATGGDAGFDMSKRVNPFQNDRVKLVSFWSGLITTNALGEASFEVDIPQFSGSLRVMAVGHKGNSFGSQEKNITVADPIVISSAIPRFLSPGDTAFIAVNISNTTDDKANGKVNLAVSGPLEVVGSAKESLTIEANKENRKVYKVYVKQALGQAAFDVSYDAFGEDFEEHIDITVRPAVPLLKTANTGSINGNGSAKLSFELDKYLTQTVDQKLVLSTNPMVEFADDLDYLVRYPYGCSEQTVSAVFPQLYYKDLIKALYDKTDETENINANIIAAINKLKMRQLYNGAIMMWDDCDCENWWVSAYAAHFLIEAKEAGFSVDDDFLNSILAYLKNRLKSKETITYYYSGKLTKKIAPKEVPYSLYVLALADESDMSLLNYYKSNTHILSNDGVYLLAAAYALSGDKEKGKSILPNSFVNEDAVRQFGGSFYSKIRDESIALNALLTIDPNHKDIGIMVKHISDYMSGKQYYLNTQDRIFALLALGKVAKMANQADINATVSANGKTIANYSNGTLSLSTKDLGKQTVTVQTEGNGRLFYFWETEGITKDGSFKQEDSHLKVRKTFYDRYGNVISNRTFEQNDLVVIKLSITADYNKRIENVVITDILPAGFEIENPRIDDVPGTSWIKKKSYPDYLDIRDDRIMFFDDVYVSNGYTQDYYYVVRAVSPGVYKMGPVGADAMYHGEYYSYHGGGVVRIE